MKFGTQMKVFGVVAVSSGWVGTLIDRAIDTEPGTQGPGMLFWLVAPLASAAVLRWRSGGWRDAGLKPRLTSSAKWYGVAAVVPLAIGAASSVLGALTGRTQISWNWAEYAGLVTATLGFNLIKNVFEEFSWRGFLASKLIDAKYGDAAIYLITGLIWGLWHVPYYLYLLDGDAMRSTLDVPRPLFALLVMIVLMGWTTVQVELFRLSGTVWVPLLLHSIHNTFVDPLGARGFVQMPTEIGLLFSPIVGLGTCLLWVSIGLGLRSIRLRKESAAAPLVGRMTFARS